MPKALVSRLWGHKTCARAPWAVQAKLYTKFRLWISAPRCQPGTTPTATRNLAFHVSSSKSNTDIRHENRAVGTCARTAPGETGIITPFYS